jgi:hypothetical protein
MTREVEFFKEGLDSIFEGEQLPFFFEFWYAS